MRQRAHVGYAEGALMGFSVCKLRRHSHRIYFQVRLALRMLKEEGLIHHEASFCYDAYQFCVLVSARCDDSTTPPIDISSRSPIFKMQRSGYDALGRSVASLLVPTAMRRECSKCIMQIQDHISSLVSSPRWSSGVPTKHLSPHYELMRDLCLSYCTSYRILLIICMSSFVRSHRTSPTSVL